MKISARNQFHGTIKSVDLAPVSAQVVISMAGGTEIVAAMTRASAERMRLHAGQAAVALVKASVVVLVTDLDGYTLSARNQFAGIVSRLERGAVSSLVGVDIGPGLCALASVTNDAVDDLGLAVGKAATATFKAYAVMVGVKA